MSKLVFKAKTFKMVEMPSGWCDFNDDFATELANRAQTEYDNWYRENIESAPVVYGRWDGKSFVVPDSHLGLRSGMTTPDTHTARLVMIEPIVKDSAESLLRELITKVNDSKINNSKLAIEACDIAERAKALLGSRGEL